jgi:Fur family ferric uptake transcriptional regulator
MHHQFNYEELLSGADLKTTPNRLRVMEVMGSNSYPLSAGDIHEILKRSSTINRVTVYRILDPWWNTALLNASVQGGGHFIMISPRTISINLTLTSIVRIADKWTV